MSRSGFSEEISAAPKQRRRWSRFVFYLATISVILVVYFRFSEIRLITELFTRSQLNWLTLIIITQAVSYFFAALNQRDVLRLKDLTLSIRELYPITFIIQFLNQALPSGGISGQAFLVYYLRRHGLTVIEGVGRAILELMTLYLAFGAMFFVSALVMAQKNVLGVHREISYFIYAFLFFAVIFTLIFLSFQKKSRGWLINWTAKLFFRYLKNDQNRKNPVASENNAEQVILVFDQLRETINFQRLGRKGKIFWAAFLWQVLTLFLNVIVLYLISIAIGSPVSFWIALVAFTLTKFLVMISFVPGGLGVFEGGMTLILVAFNVSAQPAFAMTLLLRAFTFWLPMPIGWILYRRYLNAQKLGQFQGT